MSRYFFNRNHAHIDNFHSVWIGTGNIVENENCRTPVGFIVFHGKVHLGITNAPLRIRVVEFSLHINRIAGHIDIERIDYDTAGKRKVFDGKASPFSTDIAKGNRREFFFTPIKSGFAGTNVSAIQHRIVHHALRKALGIGIRNDLVRVRRNDYRRRRFDRERNG